MYEEPLRVAVLGAGFISDYHISGLQEAGAEVVAIFGRTEEKVKAKARQFRIPSYTTDYRVILTRDDVQAVVIATPDYTHEEVAVAAAKAGKAILLQKPMARTSEECLRIIGAAKEAGVPLYMCFMHRYMEEVLKVRQLLNEGALGKIYWVQQRNATPGADWASWFFDKNNVGGGVVMQLGVHGIDLLRQLFGEIVAVHATTSIRKPARKLADGTIVYPNNEDLALATYRFASGLLAIHAMSYTELAGTSRFRMEIYGEEGTAWLRTEKGRLAIYAPSYLGHEGWFIPDLPEPRFGWRLHKHFVDMVLGKAPPEDSARDGLATVLVAEAIYRSNESGKWEEVCWP